MTLVKALMTRNTKVIVLPLEPVPATRPRVTGRGIAYYPKRHSDYKKAAIKHLEKHYDTNDQFDGPCEVQMTVVCPRPKAGKYSYPIRGDVDNLAKLPLDCLSSARPDGDGKDGRRIAWLDDRQIVKLGIVKRYPVDDEEPCTHIRITWITEVT